MTNEEHAQELDEKNRVIAHLTKTLSHTRDCLDIARKALESIAGEEGEGEASIEGHITCRKIAAESLSRI
jgi:hypothetical protein